MGLATTDASLLLLHAEMLEEDAAENDEMKNWRAVGTALLISGHVSVLEIFP
jgi:hypothetical protein